MEERIHISVDTRQVDKELDRLMKAPGMKTEVAFNALFAEVTAEVMAIIHVETGSLKSTAHWDTDPFPTGWQGTVKVGGAAPGAINDPAYYGVYELARGGSHFFFAPAYADIPSKMIEIILEFYGNGEAGMAEKAVSPTPNLGGALKTGLKSAEGAVKTEAKKVRKKAEKSFEQMMKEEERKNANRWPHVSGTGGEGLKKRSASTKAAQADKEARDRTADAAKIHGNEPSKLKPHRVTRARRR